MHILALCQLDPTDNVVVTGTTPSHVLLMRAPLLWKNNGSEGDILLGLLGLCFVAAGREGCSVKQWPVNHLDIQAYYAK